MKKLLTFAIALLVLTGTALAQVYTVKGAVTNEDDEPLPFANVRLGKAVARTDTNGRFTLNDVKAGMDTIIIDFVGYMKRYTQVDIQNDTTLPALELYPVDPTGLVDPEALSDLFSDMDETPLKEGKADGIIIIRDQPLGGCSLTKIQDGRLSYKRGYRKYKKTRSEYKYKYKLTESVCYQLTPEEMDTANRLTVEIKQRNLRQSLCYLPQIDMPTYTVELRDGDQYQCESNSMIKDALAKLYGFSFRVLEKHNRELTMSFLDPDPRDSSIRYLPVNFRIKGANINLYIAHTVSKQDTTSGRFPIGKFKIKITSPLYRTYKVKIDLQEDTQLPTVVMKRKAFFNIRRRIYEWGTSR